MTTTHRKPEKAIEAARTRGSRALRACTVTADGRIDGPALMTQAEVAALFNARRETVWSWERRGLLRSVGEGTLKRYPREAVEALLRSRRQRPAA